MRSRPRLIATAIVVFGVLAACTARVTMSSDSTGGSTDPSAPIAIVVTDDGLAGVPVGTSRPRWSIPGAVAAPDGSAVYLAENDGEGTITTRISRIDPQTGAPTEVGRWMVPNGQPVLVFAVEPGGERVALASFDGTSTLVLPFDPTTGGPTSKHTFFGDLDPEAFSLDRHRIFAARSYGDHYRVTTLSLDNGEQEDTLSLDKFAPPEDMYGNVVQAVLTPDRARLATLYRDPRSTDHTAFVHLLDLESGLTVCVDLVAPFGTGEREADALRVNPDGTIDVGHADPSGGVVASIDPTAILNGAPQRHYHAHAVPDPDPPTIPAGIAATPGFVRFVALAAPGDQR